MGCCSSTTDAKLSKEDKDLLEQLLSRWYVVYGPEPQIQTQNDKQSSLGHELSFESCKTFYHLNLKCLYALGVVLLRNKDDLMSKMRYSATELGVSFYRFTYVPSPFLSFYGNDRETEAYIFLKQFVTAIAGIVSDWIKLTWIGRDIKLDIETKPSRPDVHLTLTLSWSGGYVRI